MKIEWTSVTPSVAKVTLADDADKANYPTVVMESMGFGSLEQTEAMFRAANVTRLARGNVAGDVVFIAGKSYSSAATAAAAFKTEYGRLDQKGTLVITIGATTLTFANAVLKGVRAVTMLGCRWGIRYAFGAGTMT